MKQKDGKNHNFHLLNSSVLIKERDLIELLEGRKCDSCFNRNQEVQQIVNKRKGFCPKFDLKCKICNKKDSFQGSKDWIGNIKTKQSAVPTLSILFLVGLILSGLSYEAVYFLLSK